MQFIKDNLLVQAQNNLLLWKNSLFQLYWVSDLQTKLLKKFPYKDNEDSRGLAFQEGCEFINDNKIDVITGIITKVDR